MGRLALVHGMGAADGAEAAQPIDHVLVGGDVGLVVGQAEIAILLPVRLGDVFLSPPTKQSLRFCHVDF